MNHLEGLRDVLIDLLKDTYDAEKQLVDALPKLSKEVSDPSLKQAFDNHLVETKGHVTRLEQAFGILGIKPRGKKCKGMAGLIKEAGDASGEKGRAPLVDACIIAAAQKAEHYEIAAYGTMRAYAHALGLTDLVALFESTLIEEKAADETLTEIAQGPLLASSR